MTTLINLRRHRKRKARQAEEQSAAANRARFGRTKAERAADEEAAARADRHLDHHRLADTPASPDSTTDDDDQRHR